ncbi:MAG: sensor histidine kinase [Candidatus Nitrosotenuis sp.]
MGTKSGLLESYDVDQVKNLQKENKILLQKLQTQNRMIISYERKLANFDTIKEQRDWLLDEMTKKMGELSHFQTELFKAERLSAIGEMSARIAHDMRNPLSIIKNSIELVRIKHSKQIPADVYNLFTSIDNASSRLVFQLDDVLNFVRSSPLDYSQNSLGQILDSSIQDIVIPDQIIINKPKNNIHLFCDGEKIKAVFTNLIMNSIQAMDSQGTITVEFLESIDDVKFTIRDTGLGIPIHLIDKIFEPLFTTKSRGTGLGLPAVKMIIQQHQGKIDVSNNPTTFSITIPKRS